MTTWPKVLEDAYCYWNMLCGFGFTPDDLFLEVHGSRVFMVLYAGGSTRPQHTFRAECGQHDMTTPILLELWRKLCRDVSSGRVTDAELAEIHARSTAPTQKGDLFLALQKKGLLPTSTDLPRGTNPGPHSTA